MIVSADQQIATAKHSSRRGLTPRGMAVHYTAGADGRQRKTPVGLRHRISRWARAEDWKSSTDFVIGRDPKLDPTLQMCTGPLFERFTWHCGGSVWPGIGRHSEAMELMREAGFSFKYSADPSKRTNLWLIGIDADNYGPLDMVRDVPCYRRTRAQVRDGVAAREFKGPVWLDEDGKPWEEYPDEQIEELCNIVYRVAQECSGIALVDYPGSMHAALPIVGHEDIKSTKRDPGPAFDQFWPEIYNAAQGRYLKGVCEV